MANQTVNNVTVQIRRDTAQAWAVANPVLAEGELGFETDTRKGKVGNGSTTWNNLPYAWKAYSDFVGSGSSAASGLVPKPSTTEGDTKYLNENATWKNPSDYTVTTDTDSKYTKTVPQGAMPYASLDSIGGKTLVWNQLQQNGNFTSTSSWLQTNGGSAVSVADNVMTISITSSANSGVYSNNTISYINGHKYLYTTYVKSSVPIKTDIAGTNTQTSLGNNTWEKLSNLATWTYSSAPFAFFYRRASAGDSSETFQVKDLMIIDLTLLYGAGNEPSTVAEFKQTFPAVWYAYNPGTLLSAGVTEVVSVGKNLVNVNDNTYPTGYYLIDGSYYNSLNWRNFSVPCSAGDKFTKSGTGWGGIVTFWNGANFVSGVLGDSVTVPSGANSVIFSFDTSTANNLQVERGATATPYSPYHAPISYPIPAEVQALEGYGWSAGSVYNYIDYERKVFVKCVDKIVLDGTQTIQLTNWRADSNGVGWLYPISLTHNSQNEKNVVCDKLSTNTYGTLYNYGLGICLFNGNNTTYGICIRQTDTSLTTESAINTYLSANPITVYYELATPIETSISAYLTDDNLISVESGGTLTFPNSSGSDHLIPVPSEEKYYTDMGGFSLVARTNSYNDLIDKPTIPTVPTNVSSFTNDAGYLTSVSWNDVGSKPTFATVATSGSYNDLTDKPTIPSVYTLPTASSSTLGGVKVGSNLSIDANGVLSSYNGLPVGYEYFTMNPNVPQGSLPLFGGEYSRSTYADLWAWVQTQTGYCKTEAEWQTLSTSNNGNVPYYSDGDGSTTFRVPSLKCWIKGANGTVTEVGSYKAAGLPNIVAGTITTQDYGGTETQMTGAWNQVSHTTRTANLSGGSTADEYIYNFSASRSNSIYGNSTTVQPESIVGMWLVKAYGTIEDTGTIDEQQYIDDRIAALPTSLATTFLPLAGGEMGGDIDFTPHIATTDWSQNYSVPHSITNKYGVKGTLPLSDRTAVYMPLGVVRDTSDLPSYDGKCRYGIIEGILYSDGGTNLSFTVYKNQANSTDSAQLYIDYGTTSGDEKRLVFDGKRIDIKAVGTNYIRYGNGIQICWGGQSSSTSGTQVTFSYPFNETPRIIGSSVSSSVDAWAGNDSATGFKAISESGSPWFNWVAIGKWK